MDMGKLITWLIDVTMNNLEEIALGEGIRLAWGFIKFLWRFTKRLFALTYLLGTAIDMISRSEL